MTRSPEHLDFPTNWDHLDEPPESSEAAREIAPLGNGDGPLSSAVPTGTLLAAAWADLVSILAVCTAEFLALVLADYPATLPALPWAAALAMVWWSVAAAVLLIVRKGTPGMLMAGVVFKTSVVPQRLPAVIVVALLMAWALGLPALLGADRSPLSAVADNELAISEMLPVP